MNGRGDRPRIVHVITRLIVGGAQLSVVELCEGLRDRFEVEIVSGPQTGPEGSLQRRAAESARLTLVEALRREVSPRWDPVAVPQLRRLLRRLEPDIVHTHSSKAGIVGRFAAAPLPTRVVHTVHGWGHTPADSRPRRAAFIALERAAARHCDALLAVSADIEAEGLALGIGRPDLYRVIPDVVDLEPLEPDFAAGRQRARQELGLGEGEEAIGWVGRFVEQKDPRTLAGAVTALLRERPSSRAVLVGDGPLRGAVEEELRAAGVEQRVLLTGVVHGARRLMPAFDLLLHPSRWEGKPIVIQEALAERVPVVAAAASGVGELLDEGSTGAVVPPESPDAMARAAAAILDAPGLRAPLEGRRLARLRAEHGRELALERHAELYAALLSRPGAPPA